MLFFERKKRKVVCFLCGVLTVMSIDALLQAAEYLERRERGEYSYTKLLFLSYYCVDKMAG